MEKLIVLLLSKQPTPKKPMHSTLTCEECGGSIESHEIRYRDRKLIFCSPFCMEKNREKEQPLTVVEFIRQLKRENASQ